MINELFELTPETWTEPGEITWRNLRLVPLSAIRQAVINGYSVEFDLPLTSRYLGGLIRNRLRLKSFKRSAYMVEMPHPATLRDLCAKHGIECDLR